MRVRFNMKNKVSTDLFWPALIILFSCIPLIDLLHPGLPYTHDGRDHVARIANFYQNLQEGNLIPRWAGNLNWGYGHPILMFLYPLPSYFASLIHFFGFSLVDSTKFVFAVSYILSGLAMYLWLKEFLPKHGAFIGSLLYIIAPYRFVDLYVRGAIGEHVAFIFPPLVLYCLLKLAKPPHTLKESWLPLRFSLPPSRWFILVLGSLSLAGLILSHNAISLMFLPIIILYGIYLIWQSKKRLFLISYFSFLILFGFSLSSFFWMPAFFEGKYTLRDIVTSGSIENNFANFSQLVYGPWSYGISGQFTLQIGILQWLGVLLSFLICFYLFKNKNKLFILSIATLIIFFISIFLVTNCSQIIWEKISIMQKFQFPWRLLTLSVFASAVLGAIAVSSVQKKYRFFLVILVTFFILFFNKDYWKAKSYFNIPENFYTSVYHSTTDTGESAPIWSVRFMEKEPKSHTEVIQGSAKTKEIGRSTTNHKYEISAKTYAGIRENTIYFPGWEVLVDGKPTTIQFQDMNNRGVITFFVEKGKHNVDVRFEETKLRLIADLISGVSLIVLILLAGFRKRLLHC